MWASASDMALVRRLWACYQSRDWAAAQALFHPEACCLWWSTGERFDGAAGVVHVNAIYPEGWRLHLLSLNALLGDTDASAGPPAASVVTQEADCAGPVPGLARVHSLLRVDHGGDSFYANSFFGLRGGLIVRVDEYWSDCKAPPAWRAEADPALPGRQSMRPDLRDGWSLSRHE